MGKKRRGEEIKTNRECFMMEYVNTTEVLQALMPEVGMGAKGDVRCVTRVVCGGS